MALIPKLIGAFAVAATGYVGYNAFTTELEDFDLPACESPDNYEIEYGTVKGLTFFENSPAVALTTPFRQTIGYKEFDRGRHIIFDPVFFYFLPENEQKFIFLHECGHHVNPPSRNQWDSEFDEDCYAARRLRTEGLTLDEIVDSMGILKEGPPSHSHPSGIERKINVMQCVLS